MADQEITSAAPGQSRQWVEWIASRFADELIPTVFIKDGVKNSDLLGSYAEATVRRLVRRTVSPLQVHGGSILYERHLDKVHTAPQLDAIVWSPLITPAICQFDDFALIPRGNAFGILEIKRSDYAGAGDGIVKTLDAASDLDVPRECRIGIICVQTESSRHVDQLRKDNRVFVLIDNRDHTPKVNHRDVCSMINALNKIRTHGIQKLACLDGPVPIINTGLLPSEQ